MTRGTTRRGTVRRGLGGVMLALLLGTSLAAPVGAQEIPTGAARIVAKVQLEVLVGTTQLQTHIDRILANNAGIIPGK